MSTYDLTGNVRDWRKLVKQAQKIGLLTGALEGLRYRVDEETKKVIDEILEKAKTYDKES